MSIFITLSGDVVGVLRGIAASLESIVSIGERMAGSVDDLQAAMATLSSTISTGIGNVNTSLQTELGAIATALTAASGTPADLGPIIQQITDLGTNSATALQGVVDTLNAETTKLVPPAPAPTG